MLRLIFILGLSAFAGSLFGGERTFDFAAEPTNQPPRGFRSVTAGGGPPGDWRVILAEPPSLFIPISPKSPELRTKPALAQLSRAKTDDRYLMLVLDGEDYEDFTLTTYFKIVDGETEQMAGIAFRIQNETNYYYIRASALATNLAYLKMVNGELRPTERVVSSQPIRKGAWYELTLEARGTQFRALLNGKEALLITDTSGKQAFERGKIAFWTKSDSVCYFADVRLNYRVREPFAQTLVWEVHQKNPRLLGLKIFATKDGQSEPSLIASLDGKDLGQPAQKVEKDVIERGTTYYGKEDGKVLVTMPLHDKNGDPVAAVKIIMKPVLGQTEQHALVRAMPILKQMESRVPTLKDLTE